MKIRTITCHHVFNHGAMLQAYALVQFLRSLGHDADIIDYRPGYISGTQINFKRVPPRYDRFGFRWLYRRVKYHKNKLEQKRRNEFEVFFNNYMPVTKLSYHNIAELQEAPPKADIYIAGSDQIWNTSFPNGKDAAFYLDFGKPKRKISYAASFATNLLFAGTEDFVKEKLNNFDAISVRETSAIDILKDLGYSGEVVVDPVFLLSKEQWDSYSNNFGEGEDYILTYDFEKKHSAIGVIAKRLAKLYGCKIYSIGPYNMDYADKNHVVCNPFIFISLIKNARCIVSNSFHGSAFSMIYEKDFFIVNRKDGLNIRMQDLLGHYLLTERLINYDVEDEKLLSHIDYKIVNQMLSKDIIESKTFLMREINLCR